MVPEYTGTAAQGFGYGARTARSGSVRARSTGWCRQGLWLKLSSGNGAGSGSSGSDQRRQGRLGCGRGNGVGGGSGYGSGTDWGGEEIV